MLVFISARLGLFCLSIPHNDRHRPRAGQVPRQVGAAVPVPPPRLPRVGRVQRPVQPDSHDIRRSRHVHQAAHVRPQRSTTLTASIVWGALALAVFGYVNQQPLRQSKDASSPLLVLGCVHPSTRKHADPTQHGTRRCLWKCHAQDDARCPDSKCARCVDLVSGVMRTCIVVPIN